MKDGISLAIFKTGRITPVHIIHIYSFSGANLCSALGGIIGEFYEILTILVIGGDGVKFLPILAAGT